MSDDDTEAREAMFRELGAVGPADPTMNGAGDRRAAITLDEFVAIPREPVVPYVATLTGKTTLLAPETTMLVGGPSGLGKSLLAAFDLGGRLADADESFWLNLRVCGGLKVLLLPFEGSDEDTAERAHLVPRAARQRFAIWDRWRRGPIPQSNHAGLERLAEEIKAHETDVLILDTGSAFFGGGGGFDTSKGIPEEAHTALEAMRRLSGRRFACIVVVHTRKADRSGGKVDELEEIAGTFGKKADSAIVLRRDGDETGRGPKRKVIFAKVRRGAEPETLAATFPESEGETPRLKVLGPYEGRPSKGSAKEMADWIEAQPTVVTAADLLARFAVTEGTLRNRRSELEDLGILHRRNIGYGTSSQWESTCS